MKFKQWLIESVSFYIKDYNKSSVANISELANAIKVKLYSIPGFNKGTNSQLFDIDGFDVNAKKGILNFYTQGIPQQAISKILSAIKYWSGELGATIGEFKHDKSNLFSGEDVIRMSVSVGEAGDTPPDVNMSNDMWEILRQLMNLPDNNPNDSSISVNELLFKIDSVNDFSIQNAVIAPKRDKNWIDGGVDKERIERNLQALRNLCHWATEHDYDRIQLS